MLHTEWSAPLGLSAPLWGIIGLAALALFWQFAKNIDKGQWDKGQWD